MPPLPCFCFPVDLPLPFCYQRLRKSVILVQWCVQNTLWSTVPRGQSASQEIPSLSWNPDVHYGIHKTPIAGPCPESHYSSLHLLILFFKIYFKIILPSTPRPSKQFLSWLSHENHVRFLFCLMRATCPAHPTLDVIILIIFGEKQM